MNRATTRHFCCIVLSLLLINVVFAQRSNRIITTDYNECLVGIKDTSGNWIVPPKYIDIERLNNNAFAVTAATGTGLVDSAGRELITPLYQQLRTTVLGGYYVARNETHCGVVTTSNDTVIPLLYNDAVVMPDSTIFALHKRRKWIQFSPSGRQKKIPYRTPAAPKYAARHHYAVVKPYSFFRNKYALINDSGSVVLGMRYDLIEGAVSDLIFVQKKKKCGYFSSQGKFIWPVAFDCHTRPERNSYAWQFDGWSFETDYVFYNDTVGVAQVGGRYGLVSASGKILLPFEYDQIGRFTAGRYSEQSLWEVERNGKTGLYSVREGWIAEPELDNLQLISLYLTTEDSSAVGLYVARKNGLYGAQTTEGQVLVPFQYRDFSITANGRFFHNGDTLVELITYCSDLKQLVIENQLDLPADSTLPGFIWSKNIHDIPANKQFGVYRTADGCTVFFHPDHSADTLFYRTRPFTAQPSLNTRSGIPDSVSIASVCMTRILLPTFRIDSLHSFYNLRKERGGRSVYFADQIVLNLKNNTVSEVKFRFRDGSRWYYKTNQNFVFRDDGKILAEPNRWERVEFFRCSGQPLTLHVKNTRGECAILDSVGNYIAPPQRVDYGPFNDRYIWTNTTPNRSSGSRFNQRWVLIDRMTGKKAKADFAKGSSFTQLWNDMTVSYSGKKGEQLYDLAQNKYVTGGYNNIVPLNDSATFFLVQTCSRKTGAIDKYGKLVLDTQYFATTDFIHTGGYCYLDGSSNYRSGLSFYQYVCFYTDSSHAILNTSTGKTVHDSVMLNYITGNMRAYPDTFTNRQMSRASYSATGDYSQVVMHRRDSAGVRPWHILNLFDSLTQPQRYEESRWELASGEIIPLCGYCRQKNDPWFYTVPEQQFGARIIQYATDSVLSYCIDDNYYGAVKNQTTVMLFPDGPRNMTLDSLFDPQSDWKNFVINAVIGYVNSHLYVEGDCHNPAALPALLAQSWTITNEGIWLYPPEFTEASQQLRILLDWNAVKPYLRADVASKLPAKN